MTKTEEQNLELAQRIGSAWQANELDSVRDLIHEDAVMFAPEGWPEPGPFKGRDAFIGQQKRLVEDWDETSANVLQLRAIGDWVVNEFVYNTRGKGSGTTVSTVFCSANRYQDGQLIEQHWFWNFDEALAAAG